MNINFEIVTLDWEKVIDKNTEIPKQSGVYQIYGDSPIYGQNQLLYIGKADNLFNRIVSGHNTNENSFITRQPNISYRFALVPVELNQIIEEILIAMHKPSFNTMSMIQINSKCKEYPIYIQNQNERGMLHLELTNFYFLDEKIKERYKIDK